MSKGRKPKPTALKILQGNAGKRKLNHNEPNFSDVVDIEPPDWLDDLAVQMWQTIMPELLANKILTVADIHNVEAFCMAYARWRQAENEITRLGVLIMDDNGRYSKNPAFTVVNEAKKQMATFGGLLGLDPSSRTRLTGSAQKTTIANPFADL